jgi:hypothetical protein
MLKTGKFHQFKINKPKIEISKCNSLKLPINDLNMSNRNLARLIEIHKNDAESINSAFFSNEEDLQSISTCNNTNEDMLDPVTLNKKKIKRINKKVIKRNRDIKLSLLMIFSASFIVLVLPETILNIYSQNEKLRQFYLLDIFFLLKIIQLSSNFLAYLTLITFGKVKIKKNIFV